MGHKTTSDAIFWDTHGGSAADADGIKNRKTVCRQRQREEMQATTSRLKGGSLMMDPTLALFSLSAEEGFPQ